MIGNHPAIKIDKIRDQALVEGAEAF